MGARKKEKKEIKNMGPIKSEVILCTSSDERYPPSNAVDGKPSTFFITTGNYPQELILGFKCGCANITKICLSSNGIRKIKIEKSVESTPSKFETLVECEMDYKEDSNSSRSNRQLEQFQINKGTVGNGVRYLKLVLLSGYNEFSAIFDFSAEGDEVDLDM